MLSSEQKSVFIYMLIGLIIAFIVVLVPLANPLLIYLNNILYIVIPLIIIGITYVFGIAHIAKMRFFDQAIINPLHEIENIKLLKAKQYLSNTLEQVVLATLVYILIFLIISLDSLYMITLLSIVFFIGRVLFFIGYDKGASRRALGFTLTFYPTVIAGLVVILEILMHFIKLSLA